MEPTCSVCSSTDISENNFCNNCGNVVCHVCGNEGAGDGWDEPEKENGNWVSYCKGCGAEVKLEYNPFNEQG